jgi:hypothetical protein
MKRRAGATLLLLASALGPAAAEERHETAQTIRLAPESQGGFPAESDGRDAGAGSILRLPSPAANVAGTGSAAWRYRPTPPAREPPPAPAAETDSYFASPSWEQTMMFSSGAGRSRTMGPGRQLRDLGEGISANAVIGVVDGLIRGR